MMSAVFSVDGCWLLTTIAGAYFSAYPAAKPTLEVNPHHPLLKRVEEEGDSAKAADLANLLLDQAEIAAGAQLPDPAAFVQRLNRLIVG